MASLTTQQMPYSNYYPSSGAVEHAGRRPAPDEGRGSFGPVLVVLAVISFLAIAACIAGRLCGRRSSSSRGKPSAEQLSADVEKGFGVKHPAGVMMPLPSSSATVHDVVDDDVFEIKLAPVKPAGSDKCGTGGGGIRMVQALPQPQLGLPQQYAVAGLSRCAPANGGGIVRQAHPQVRGAGESFSPAKQRG